MKIIGTVIEADGELATVEVDEAESETAVKPVFTAANRAGARTGDRVEVEVPEIVEDRGRAIVYAVPLAGVLAGAVSGRLIALIDPLARTLEKIGGPLLGKLMASGDNLALAGGLIGLGVSVVALAMWIKKKNDGAFAAARVIEVLSRQQDRPADGR